MVTEEQIEAVARSLAGLSPESEWSDCDVWFGTTEEFADGYRIKARAALEAAHRPPNRQDMS